MSLVLEHRRRSREGDIGARRWTARSLDKAVGNAEQSPSRGVKNPVKINKPDPRHAPRAAIDFRDCRDRGAAAGAFGLTATSSAQAPDLTSRRRSHSGSGSATNVLPGRRNI